MSMLAISHATTFVIVYFFDLDKLVSKLALKNSKSIKEPTFMFLPFLDNIYLLLKDKRL